MTALAVMAVVLLVAIFLSLCAITSALAEVLAELRSSGPYFVNDGLPTPPPPTPGIGRPETGHGKLPSEPPRGFGIPERQRGGWPVANVWSDPEP